MKQRKSGFTLIELLVVIAIIAILAAILFPVFAQARAKARQVVCMSDEKQLTTGILMYNQDYNDRWIDACPGYNYGELDQNCALKTSPKFGSPLYVPHWIKSPTPPVIAAEAAADENYLLKPYLKNTGVAACPTIHPEEDIDGTFKGPNYAMNELWFNAPNNPGYTPPDYISSPERWKCMGAGGRLASQLASPASLIVIWEHNNRAVLCNTWSTDATHWDASHQGGFNAAFADGHVKRYTVTQLRNQLVCYWTLP